MPSYTDLVKTLPLQTKQQEDALPVRNDGCRSQFFLQPNPTGKVCLFLHGFTAAPYQFIPIGQAFFNAGYSVLIPRLPGHGQAGNWSKTNPPPLPTDPQVYKQFASQWFQQAQAFGDRVIVGGLSGGGTLSSWLALENPQAIYRTLLFAPFLSSSSKVVDMFVKMMDSYFEWQVAPGIVPIGYPGFLMPALKTLLDMGAEILKRSESQSIAPLFVVSSESDHAVSNTDHEVLFNNVLKRQPLSWYLRFSRVLDIPHSMMTQEEGNQYQDLLITLARAYVDSNLTWANVQDIGYQMAQGNTFSSAVGQLNLSQNASPDMPAMMTMVDKRAISDARNPSIRHR